MTFEIEHKAIRDLKWIFETGSLVDQSYFSDILPQEWFRAVLDEHEVWFNENAQLFTDFSWNGHRLGFYFEDLLCFFFKVSPHFNLLLDREQVIDSGITLGEIDFVIEDYLFNKVRLIETSVKFYINEFNENELSCWVGPNTNDNFEKRLTKAKNQLNLIKLEVAQELLSDKTIQLDTTNLLITGRLYTNHNNLNIPSNITPDGIVRLKDLSDLPKEGHYNILPKVYWLSNCSLHAGELPNYRQPEIINFLRKSDGVTMFARLNREHGNYQEIERFAFLPEGWP